ncbi:MAG: TrkH family potassium uptake protein [Bacteroidales bacterium]|nr:TrkH family potassium uptake protein [Bacteroidales bacterium]
MNWKGISRNTGFALLVSALFMLLSVFVSMLNGNDSACAALIISFTITFIVGAFPFIFVRKTEAITLREGYVTIILSWLLSFVFGMLPYALWGGPFSVVNAWFESVSGYTATGATILDNIEALPDSLLFWRSSTHFIGGLGVVVFLLLIIPDSSPVKLRLVNMEVGSLSRGAYGTSTNKMVLVFACVYFGIFLLATILYLICGMSVFDSVCHAMSVSATGGFSTRNASIGAFGSRGVEAVTMLCMYLSSLHFGLIFMAVVGRSLKPLNNTVVKFYTAAVLLFSLVLGAGLKSHGFFSSWGESLWNGLFEVLCISTTSGFAIADNALWPPVLTVPLMMVALVCGCAGSTSGGIKVDRSVLLLKSVGRQINRILHPTSVNEVRLGGKVLRDDIVLPQILYILLYAMLLAVSVALCLFLGVDHRNAFAASITSLGNVGPALGELGSMGSFNSVPEAAKFVFSFDMFLGRIEIYPMLALVAMIFDRRHRR